MTTHAHTPGPWRMEKPGHGFFYQVVDEATHDIICQTDNEACARFIAAAPQLVEALKLCQVRVFMTDGSENEAYQKAQAALRLVEEGKP